jgi:hypothetical protein
MAKQRHAGFEWVKLQTEPMRPLNFMMTRRQFDCLYGLAMAYDTQAPRSFLTGEQTLVAQFIRDIADGKLEVVRPTPASIQIEP